MSTNHDIDRYDMFAALDLGQKITINPFHDAEIGGSELTGRVIGLTDGSVRVSYAAGTLTACVPFEDIWSVFIEEEAPAAAEEVDML